MLVKENSLRGRVIEKRNYAGRPNWNLEQTLGICIEANNELEAMGINPAPKFRKAIKSDDQPYLKRWVQGCHFDWLNPR